MGTIAQDYSGVVIDQDQNSVASLTLTNSLVYQEFRLPQNHVRGTNTSELNYPDLSGFQLFTTITPGYASAASLDWTLDQFISGSGWANLTAGTTIGAHADGSKVWYDIYFPQTVPSEALVVPSPQLLRFGVAGRSASGATLNLVVPYTNGYAFVNGNTIAANLTEGVPYPVTVNNVPSFLILKGGVVYYSVQQGITGIWYTQPNPLGVLGAFNSSMTALTHNGLSYSFNFRILGLIADSGIDFLGNAYRSVVVTKSASNTDTTGTLNPGSIGHWMSDPCPSPFGVKSIYHDVRPVPSSPTYGQMNLIGNPNFSWDNVGSFPLWWSALATGATGTTSQVSATWSSGASQSYHQIATLPNNSAVAGLLTPAINIAPTQSVYLQGQLNVVTLPANTAITMTINWFNAASTLISSTTGAVTATGIQAFALTGVPPVSTASVTVSITATNTSGASKVIEYYVDQISFVQALALPTTYGDGDSVNWVWTGQKGQSVSVQVITAIPQNNTTVIDSVLVDPITPNVGFNVYYSTDDTGTSATMSESDWEGKLWTHVPQTYVMNKTQRYYFPSPIVAKYVKIEFSSLQAQTYNPGNFSKAVPYKKFPKWVADFFIALMEQPSFTASRVAVQYDALTFAYDYFLDDIQQTPAGPPTTSDISTLNNFFTNLSDVADQVDPTTLRKINLALNIYTSPPGTQAHADTLLGRAVLSKAFALPNYPIEGDLTVTSGDYTDVSSLNREQIVFEQSMPVMFFYLTSRHAYREVMAKFDNNRAYFAGVNSIAFMRDNYGISTDGQLYLETGGDTVNATINDFVLDSNNNMWPY